MLWAVFNFKIMYYIERIINGILCCKWTPDGEWQELSKEKMTEKILALKAEIETLKAQQEIKEHGTTMWQE